MDVLNALRKSEALLEGHFILSSGLHSDKYVQCARLLQFPKFAKEAGTALSQKITHLKAQKIVSPALGGLIIGHETAEALDIPHVFVEKKDGKPVLRRGFKINKGERIVIVEDVVTTGLSANEVVKVIESYGGIVVGMASIINRSGKDNPFPIEYNSLYSVDLSVYKPENCPMCEKGDTAIKPGSRVNPK